MMCIIVTTSTLTKFCWYKTVGRNNNNIQILFVKYKFGNMDLNVQKSELLISLLQYRKFVMLYSWCIAFASSVMNSAIVENKRV